MVCTNALSFLDGKICAIQEPSIIIHTCMHANKLRHTKPHTEIMHTQTHTHRHTHTHTLSLSLSLPLSLTNANWHKHAILTLPPSYLMKLIFMYFPSMKRYMTFSIGKRCLNSVKWTPFTAIWKSSHTSKLYAELKGLSFVSKSICTSNSTT